MASSNSNNKRRRTAADTPHISDLPVGFIVDVSAYLAKPSRALLAAAFSARSSWKNDNDVYQLSPISTAIITASQWDILDFEDDGKELANKLTDDDVSAVLTCINAHDVLKKLKLYGCINIEGHGLNPLRGSVVLEQIDISFSGKYEQRYIKPQPKISQEVVVPILDSIISANGCSLKYIQFPYKWLGREYGSLESSGPVREFRGRFNSFLSIRNQGVNCIRCNAMISLDLGEWLNDWFQNRRMCYECLQGPICNTCTRANNGVYSCTRCRKKYCDDCVPRLRCQNCRVTKCSGCGEMGECDECEEALCKSCLNTCVGCGSCCCEDCSTYYWCEGDNCKKAHCDDCYNGEEYDVDYCEDCNSSFCLDCKLGILKKDGEDACRGCSGDVALHLLKQNTKLVKEVGELTKDNQELRDKVNSLSLS